MAHLKHRAKEREVNAFTAIFVSTHELSKCTLHTQNKHFWKCKQIYKNSSAFCHSHRLFHVLVLTSYCTLYISHLLNTFIIIIRLSFNFISSIFSCFSYGLLLSSSKTNVHKIQKWSVWKKTTERTKIYIYKKRIQHVYKHTWNSILFFFIAIRLNSTHAHKVIFIKSLLLIFGRFFSLFFCCSEIIFNFYRIDIILWGRTNECAMSSRSRIFDFKKSVCRSHHNLRVFV